MFQSFSCGVSFLRRSIAVDGAFLTEGRENDV
jgi:hypothetical protein